MVKFNDLAERFASFERSLEQLARYTAESRSAAAERAPGRPTRRAPVKKGPTVRSPDRSESHASGSQSGAVARPAFPSGTASMVTARTSALPRPLRCVYCHAAETADVTAGDRVTQIDRWYECQRCLRRFAVTGEGRTSPPR